MFDVGDFIFSYDLKSAYHHIEIFEEHQQYLGFAWFFRAKHDISYSLFSFFYFYSRLYLFTCLREVVKYFRSNCKGIIMFLDDGLAGENDYDTAVKGSKQVNDQLYTFVFFFKLLMTNITSRLVRN